jgi:hypothetical protein
MTPQCRENREDNKKTKPNTNRNYFPARCHDSGRGLLVKTGGGKPKMPGILAQNAGQMPGIWHAKWEAFGGRLGGVWRAKWEAFGRRLVCKKCGVSPPLPANHFDTKSVIKLMTTRSRT